MEGFTRFEDEKPTLGVEVTVAHSGKLLRDTWMGTAWQSDPSRTVMYMWWKS